MPKRKRISTNAKSRKRARYMRKAKRRSRAVTTVVRGLTPYPPRMITKMKYCETVSFALGTGFKTARFNLNSIFDPNRTGVGHQPYGRDQYATIYNRYRVIKCHWAVTISGTSASAIMVVCCPANEEIATPAFLENVKERSRARYALQGADVPYKTIKGKTYIPSLTGRTRAQYMADDRYQSDMGSSPAELAILNIFGGNERDDPLSSTSMAFNVTLKYFVELFDVNSFATS